MDESKIIERGIDTIISMIRSKASIIGDSNFEYVTKNIVGTPFYKLCSKGDKKFARVYAPVYDGNVPYVDLSFAVSTYTRRPTKPIIVGHRGVPIYSWINLDNTYIHVHISTSCNESLRDEGFKIEDQSVIDMLQERVKRIEELAEKSEKRDCDDTEPCKGDSCSTMSAIDAVCSAMSPKKDEQDRTSLGNLIRVINESFKNAKLGAYTYDEETKVLSTEYRDGVFNEMYLTDDNVLVRQSKYTSGTIIAKDAFYNGVDWDVWSNSDFSTVKVIEGTLYIVEVDFGINRVQYRIPNEVMSVNQPCIIKWRDLTEDDIHEIHAYLNGDANDSWIMNMYYSNELTEEMKFN